MSESRMLLNSIRLLFYVRSFHQHPMEVLCYNQKRGRPRPLKGGPITEKTTISAANREWLRTHMAKPQCVH